MAGKQGSGGRSSTPQYLGGSSDKRYQKETQQRLRQQAWKTWGIRLVVVAALATAAKLWGPTVMAAIARSGKETVSSVAKGGQGLRSGVDERSGANLKDDQ